MPLRKFRVQMFCPSCGRPVQLLASEVTVAILRRLKPETPIEWMRCGNRSCGERVEVTARAYRDAVDVRRSAA